MLKRRLFTITHFNMNVEEKFKVFLKKMFSDDNWFLERSPKYWKLEHITIDSPFFSSKIFMIVMNSFVIWYEGPKTVLTWLKWEPWWHLASVQFPLKRGCFQWNRFLQFPIKVEWTLKVFFDMYVISIVVVCLLRCWYYKLQLY